MKKTIKIVGIVLAILMVFSIMTACSQSDEPTSNEAETNSANSTDVSNEDNTATTEDSDKPLIAYLSSGDSNAFWALLTKGMNAAAELYKDKYDYMAMDNDWKTDNIIKNVNEAIAAGADVIFYNTIDSSIEGTVTDMAKEAGVQLILMETPFPEDDPWPAYGCDNVIAGGIGGEYLGQQAVELWDGDYDLYVSCELPSSEFANNQRMVEGFMAGASKYIDLSDDSKVERIDTQANMSTAMQKMQDVLSAHPDAKRILVACLCDDDAAGALKAIENMNYDGEAIICGQGFYGDIAENNFLVEEDNAWKATVSYGPELYGVNMFKLADAYLSGEEIPLHTVFDHQLVTRENAQAVKDDITAKLEGK